MIDKLKDRKHKALTIEIEIEPEGKEEKIDSENKKMGLAPDLKLKDGPEDLKDGEVVGQDDPIMKEKLEKMKDADAALKGNLDEQDEIQFERMIDRGEQPKSLLEKARFKMYADKKGYESR